MRLEYPCRSERFGAVRIHELQRVIELDSGVRPAMVASARFGPPVDLAAKPSEVERELVIVVPCMNETRRVIEGVLSGIPHDCLIVLVSNSDRGPVDRYEIERADRRAVLPARRPPRDHRSSARSAAWPPPSRRPACPS